MKPRFVIFHISATKEEIETQVRPHLRDEFAMTCLWFTTVNRVNSGLGIWWGFQVVLLGEESVSTFGGIERRLVPGGFEVLSSVESGINGPHSGPDHPLRWIPEDSHL